VLKTPKYKNKKHSAFSDLKKKNKKTIFLLYLFKTKKKRKHSAIDNTQKILYLFVYYRLLGLNAGS